MSGNIRKAIGSHRTLVGGRAMTVLAKIMQNAQDGLPPPSVRQIRDHLGAHSTHFVFFLLKKLEKAGLVKHEPHTARTWVPAVRFIKAEDLEPLGEG
jgi:hypothetical protein